ncbi:MAG: hypothetical protein EOO65_04135 [Methanosarcinales archaeon]|nr:MAG: hypothetical protein EOO65_04135 [Methanosarcinales archaeon]
MLSKLAFVLTFFSFCERARQVSVRTMYQHRGFRITALAAVTCLFLCHLCVISGNLPSLSTSAARMLPRAAGACTAAERRTGQVPPRIGENITSHRVHAHADS